MLPTGKLPLQLFITDSDIFIRLVREQNTRRRLIRVIIIWFQPLPKKVCVGGGVQVVIKAVRDKSKDGWGQRTRQRRSFVCPPGHPYIPGDFDLGSSPLFVKQSIASYGEEKETGFVRWRLNHTRKNL